jgi:uncharacterized protein with HEPN domain
MNDEKRILAVLKKIVKYCDEIEQTKERFELSIEKLQFDNVCRNAIAMCLLQIGELTTHLSDDFKTTNNSIPWQSIKMLRNIVAHRYAEIDWTIIWQTMKSDIPLLRSQCLLIIETIITGQN